MGQQGNSFIPPPLQMISECGILSFLYSFKTTADRVQNESLRRNGNGNLWENADFSQSMLLWQRESRIMLYIIRDGEDVWVLFVRTKRTSSAAADDIKRTLVLNPGFAFYIRQNVSTSFAITAFCSQNCPQRTAEYVCGNFTRRPCSVKDLGHFTRIQMQNPGLKIGLERTNLPFSF